MKKVLFILMAVFIMACGRSKTYDMKFADFKAKAKNAIENATKMAEPEWNIYYNETNETKKEELKENYNKKYEQYLLEDLEISHEDYLLLQKAIKRLQEADLDRLNNSTVAELIDTQKQIEGK